jgi:hypothetical protein
VEKKKNEKHGREEALRESLNFFFFLVSNGLYGNVDLDLGWDLYFSSMIS